MSDVESLEVAAFPVMVVAAAIVIPRRLRWKNKIRPAVKFLEPLAVVRSFLLWGERGAPIS
jgi:hypothetical protein